MQAPKKVEFQFICAAYCRNQLWGAKSHRQLHKICLLGAWLSVKGKAQMQFPLKLKSSRIYSVTG